MVTADGFNNPIGRFALQPGKSWHHQASALHVSGPEASMVLQAAQLQRQAQLNHLPQHQAQLDRLSRCLDRISHA